MEHGRDANKACKGASMIEELLSLQRSYIRMGYSVDDAREAAAHEYKFKKELKGKKKKNKT